MGSDLRPDHVLKVPVGMCKVITPSSIKLTSNNQQNLCIYLQTAHTDEIGAQDSVLEP